MTYGSPPGPTSVGREKILSPVIWNTGLTMKNGGLAMKNGEQFDNQKWWFNMIEPSWNWK